MPPDPVAEAALRTFIRMQLLAHRKIDEGALTFDQANAKLRPWAAIALHCGAMPRELAEQGHYAADLARRAEWVPVLAAARDRALDAHYAGPTPEREEHGRDLMRICQALAWDRSGRHPIPPYSPSALSVDRMRHPASSSEAIGQTKTTREAA